MLSVCGDLISSGPTPDVPDNFIYPSSHPIGPAAHSIAPGACGITYDLKDDHVLYLNDRPYEFDTQDFQVASDGALYWLGTSEVFRKRSTDGNWTTFADDITQFGVNDNGLRYTLNEDHFLAINDSAISGWTGVKDFHIAPDDTLHILKQSGWFGRRLAGETQWNQVISSGITKFDVVDNGTSYALSDTAVLFVNGDTAWSDTKDFTVTTDDTLYWLGNSGKYQTRVDGVWTTLVESGIDKIATSEGGTSYGLNETTHQLYQGSTSTYSNTEDFALSRAGKIYRLSTDGLLQYETESGNWQDAIGNVEAFALDAHTGDVVADTQRTIITGELTGASTSASGSLTIDGETIALAAVENGLRGNGVNAISITYGVPESSFVEWGAVPTSDGTPSSAQSFIFYVPNTLYVSTPQAEGVADLNDIISAINSGSALTASLGSADGTALIESEDVTNAVFDLHGGQNTVENTLFISMALDANDYSSTTVSLSIDTSLPENTTAASYNATTDTIEATYNGEVSQYNINGVIWILDEVDQVVSYGGLGDSLQGGNTPQLDYSGNIIDSDANNLVADFVSDSTAISVQGTVDPPTQASVWAAFILPTWTARKGVISGDVTTAQSQATGTLTIGGETIGIAASFAGDAEGLEGNEVTVINIIYGTGASATSYNPGTNTLNVSVTQPKGTADLDDFIASVNGGTDFITTKGSANGAALVESTDEPAAVFIMNGGQNAIASDTLTIVTAENTNDFNNTRVTIEADTTVAQDSAVAAYNSSADTIEVTYNGNVRLWTVATAIASLDEFGIASFATGTGILNSGANNADASAVVNTTAGAPGGITEDVVFELSGQNGSHVFAFTAGTGISSIIDQVNLLKNATGVEASSQHEGVLLVLRSLDYGEESLVDLRILSEGDQPPSQFGTFTDAIGSGMFNFGKDITLTFGF